MPQAIELDKQLTDKRKVDILLNLDVPFEIIIGRMSKRFTHLKSGRVYNLEFNAPKVPVCLINPLIALLLQVEECSLLIYMQITLNLLQH